MKDVESKIVTIRNERVILDCDVAALYGVPTKEINQAVRNNPEKFPAGYTFQTTNEEKKEVVKNFDHLEKMILSIFIVLTWSDFYGFEAFSDVWFCGSGASGLR